MTHKRKLDKTGSLNYNPLGLVTEMQTPLLSIYLFSRWRRNPEVSVQHGQSLSFLSSLLVKLLILLANVRSHDPRCIHSSILLISSRFGGSSCFCFGKVRDASLFIPPAWVLAPASGSKCTDLMTGSAHTSTTITGLHFVLSWSGTWSLGWRFGRSLAPMSALYIIKLSTSVNCSISGHDKT